jgi:hypothetical protein
MGKYVLRSHLVYWLDNDWRKVLGYSLRFHILVKGWLCFEVRSVEYLEVILAWAWL